MGVRVRVHGKAWGVPILLARGNLSPTDSLRVQEDENNQAIVHSARDALKLIQNKFLPAVGSWVQVGGVGECP